ncbi:MAG: Glutamate-1-semialdehyde 2,1-aminomutase [Chlamydiia bacterium]|nr:Glutamate-1-semialdehyde 2,1-aminomutase [Chlamydiia bacterium]MCH9615515.1 Glutamate-1-semialdehyde 2,1-aminomutase [Chlamydiia bacterium]MCH9629170.1 Glutamate-1-semialdehyde 2,1-aminomutase [Chlamydiia bacterium]
MKRTLSENIFQASCDVIPGGVNSPARSFPGMGISPLVVNEGFGPFITDVDDNTFIDYCMSWGASILGHAHPKLVEAAVSQVKKGSSYGITTDLEMRFAARVCEIMPSIEMLRCVCSGTEAVMTAIRLARGYTGRDLVIKFEGHYHGHSDTLLPGKLGVTEQKTLVLPFNDLESVKEALLTKEVAAVVLEPIMGNSGCHKATQEFIEGLRAETALAGTVLLFDEVITGFRVGLTGAQGLYGVTPDLTTLGKVIGGGYPIAALGGRREIMECLAPTGKVFQAGTLAGNPVGMAAGLVTLDEVTKDGFYEALDEKGSFLTEDINVNRVGSMFSINEKPFKELFLRLLECGVYIPPSSDELSFISIAHSDEVLEKTKDIFREVMISVGDAIPATFSTSS